MTLKPLIHALKAIFSRHEEPQLHSSAPTTGTLPLATDGRVGPDISRSLSMYLWTRRGHLPRLHLAEVSSEDVREYFQRRLQNGISIHTIKNEAAAIRRRRRLAGLPPLERSAFPKYRRSAKGFARITPPRAPGENEAQ